MTDQPVSVPDLRAGLIDNLRAARTVERAILEALDPDERDAPAADGGWSPKDIQAHLSAWRRHQADRMAGQRTGVADEEIPATETDATTSLSTKRRTRTQARTRRRTQTCSRAATVGTRPGITP